MSRIIAFMAVIGILAACGQPGAPVSPTLPSTAPATSPAATQPAPTPPAPIGTPIRVDLTPAQRAALQALTTKMSVPADQIKLISTEAVRWPDGCLGIVHMGVMCTQGPVDGFRIILEAKGQQVEYHTNQDGTSVGHLAKAPFVSIAVRLPDNSVQVVETRIPVDPRPVVISTGLQPQAGAAAGTIYALDFTQQPRAVAVDAKGTHPLDFVHNPSYGLAVTDKPGGARLGWATSPGGQGTSSQLFVSASDGSQLSTLLTDTMPITAPHQWVAQRWSQDGKAMYYSTEPYGIGGYILFGGASSLYRVDVQDRGIQEVIPYSADGGKLLCIDELSSDERLTADHCAETSIAIRDLRSGQTTTIQPPAEVSGFQVMGSARFSPDMTRIAYALAKRNPDAEQGWVAVSDGLSGASKLIATSQPGEFFTVVGWVNPDTLLLQSNAVQCNPACTNAVWTVGIDGHGLTKITDGTFLTLVNG